MLFLELLLTNNFIKHYFENIFSMDIKMKLSVSYSFPKFRRSKPLSKFFFLSFQNIFSETIFWRHNQRKTTYKLNSLVESLRIKQAITYIILAIEQYIILSLRWMPFK